jgi:hypothetical protein
MEQSNHGGGGDGGKEQEKRRRQVLDYVEDLHDDEEDFLEDNSPADAAGGSSSPLQMEDSSDAMQLAKSSERNSAANAMLDSLDAGTFDEEPKLEVYDDQKKAAASQNVVSLTTFTTTSTNNNTINKQQQRGDDGPNKTSLHRQNPITITGALRVYGDSPPIQQPLQEDRHSDDNGRLRDQEGIQDTLFAVQATLVEEDDANNNSEHSTDLEAAVAVSNKTGLSPTAIVKAEPIKNNTKTSWKLWAIIALLMAIVLGMAIGIPLTRDREDHHPRKDSSDD